MVRTCWCTWYTGWGVRTFLRLAAFRVPTSASNRLAQRSSLNRVPNFTVTVPSPSVTKTPRQTYTIHGWIQDSPKGRRQGMTIFVFVKISKARMKSRKFGMLGEPHNLTICKVTNFKMDLSSGSALYFSKALMNTRMHSSRMRTGRSLTVCRSLLPGGGGLLPWRGGLLPGAVAQHYIFQKHWWTQECIPVGCVPAAHWPYAKVCFPGGGSASLDGGFASLEGVSASRGSASWRGVVCLPGGGGGILACTEGDPH